VVRAIIDKHNPSIETHRHQLLDHYEADASSSLRDLSAALVLPLASKLSDADGGLEYLQINAELVNQPRFVEPPRSKGDASSIDRWRVLVEPYLEQDATRLHRRFTAIRFTSMEIGRRAASGPHTDDRLFISQLVDLVTSLLLAPVSPSTAALTVDRDRHLQSR
jgi:hypothetical protein